ncbi:MAG: ABC transporter substrate-binding protein [Solirubrobacterales bacterium]|nr:ABC transporter substrate-binding protein [Solirubrobacterales bacterium]
MDQRKPVDGLRTRRRLLKQAAGGALGIYAVGALAACGDSDSSGGSSSDDGKLASSLNALCWEGYTDKAFVSDFTKKTGVKINSTFIGSNDELIAKLRGSPGQYDLISPSSDTTNLLIDEDQVQPINIDNVPNAKTTFEFFRTAPNVNVDGELYGIPMCWGFIPLIYDETKVETKPDSWEALWDPAYADQVSVWQDIALIWTTGLLLGFEDVYNLDDDQLTEIKDKLIEQKSNIRKYWTSAGELTNLFANGEVSIGMSFGGLTVTQLRAQGKKVSEIVPKEGATSWFDNWMIPKSSTKASTAEAFLNHIQTPKAQKQIAAVTGYGITNKNAIDLVPKDYAEAYRLDNPDFISELDYWKPVPRRQQYLDVLNAVVAA